MAGINDYLHILSSESWAGENFINVRGKFFTPDDIKQDAIFTMPGSTATVSGEWVAEGGDATLSPAMREPRILGKKGKLTLKFTGTNVSIRLGLNPGWGSGDCYIDGKKPKAIAGTVYAVDSVTCDSDVLGSWGNEYKDYLIVDGLALGEHTLEIYCNNAAKGSGGFFVTTGAKVFAKNNLKRERAVWVLGDADLKQVETLTFHNRSATDVKGVKLTCPANLVNPETRAPLGAVDLGTIKTGESKAVSIMASMVGNEHGGPHPVALTLEGDYTAETVNSGGSYVPAGAGLVYSGSWSSDSEFGELREYCSTKGGYLAATINAAEFTLRVQKDYGWGKFFVMKDTITATGCKITSASPSVVVPAAFIGSLAVGMYANGTNVARLCTITAIDTATNTITLSANCTANNSSRTIEFDTKFTEVNCHDEEGGGYFIDVLITGLTYPSGNKIKLVADSTKAVVWSRISWEGSDPLEHRVETINYALDYKHVQPFPLEGLRLENGQGVWEPGSPSLLDVHAPFDNSDVHREELGVRFPTYLVIYQPGYLDTIKQYDLAVVDPFGMTRKQVKELQALGIKVLLYVSFGEEDGTLLDKWDPNSAQVPWVGDGKGPGGYASYYMKAGHGYGEMSECTHDCQRSTGEKKCELANPKYNTNLGRCTGACGNDWREGYSAWDEGGQCGGGYTRDNNWIRDASKACSNTACPKYAPGHQKCTQYVQADVWGQDFSVMTDFPDENGIWSSYYVDPIPRHNNSWFARLRDYYLPLIFDEPKPRDEILRAVKVVLDPEDVAGSTSMALECSFAPIDEDEPLQISDSATGYVYQQGVEWDMDAKLGIVKLHPNEGSPAVVEGQLLNFIYSSKGLGADGVFMDTVDTVDIYPDEDYQVGAAALINELKELYPEKAFCSNRGFSILDRIIHSCSYVMFETFLSEYDWENKVYYKIGKESSDWNDEITLQLMELRKKNVFDVLALNYCSNGPEGDELREFIRQEATKRGWISWSSEIMLNKPLPNTPFKDKSGPLRTNLWKVHKFNRKNGGQ